MIIVNNNINFLKYNNEDERHRKALRSMIHDEGISKRTGPIVQDIVLQEDAFLVEIEGTIVGLIDFNEDQDDCYISYAILDEERRKGYLTSLLKEVPNYVFKTSPNVKEVLLYIEKDNKGSINGALSAGFKLFQISNSIYNAYGYPNPNVINKTK